MTMKVFAAARLRMLPNEVEILERSRDSCRAIAAAKSGVELTTPVKGARRRWPLGLSIERKLVGRSKTAVPVALWALMRPDDRSDVSANETGAITCAPIRDV